MAKATISRKTLVSILTKMEVPFTNKIPAGRAQKKLERAVEKDGLPDDAEWDEDEIELLEELGLLAEDSDDEEEEEEEEDDEDDDEEEDEEEEEEEEEDEDDDEEEDEEEEEEEEEEKPAKTKKGKGKKDAKGKGKKEKAKPKVKREGNVDKMKRLVKEGKTQDEILEDFTAVYNAAGKDDTGWIKSRVIIYGGLAGAPWAKKEKKKPAGKSAKGKSKDKKEKPAKTKKGKGKKGKK